MFGGEVPSIADDVHRQCSTAAYSPNRHALLRVAGPSGHIQCFIEIKLVGRVIRLLSIRLLYVIRLLSVIRLLLHVSVFQTMYLFEHNTSPWIVFDLVVSAERRANQRLMTFVPFIVWRFCRLITLRPRSSRGSLIGQCS